jgi:signal transduction histidine kinase
MARRLLLSYLTLIVVSVALLGLIVRLTTAQTFSRYLSDQAAAHSEMLPVMLAGYYTRHGTWDGVQPDVDQASVLIGAQVTLADAGGRIVAASRRDLLGQTIGDESALGLAIPVVGSGGSTVGTAYVGRSLAQQRADEAFLANVTRALIAGGLLVALLAAGLGVLLARSISQPLTKMAQAAARIAQGDYEIRVPLRGRDEVAALARAFNQMAEGMRDVERLRRELVANVSHDLRTPLTVIRGYLEGLRSDQIADRRSAEMAFDAMHAEVNRLLRLVEDLRQVAALDAGALPLERRPIAVADLVQDSVARIAPLARDKAVTLINELPDDLPAVNVDPERMGQVLVNLLDNAVRYTPAGGLVSIQCSVISHQSSVISKQSSVARCETDVGNELFTDHCLLITVTDTGEGITPEHLPHIFERFYRVDPARGQADGGAGLGLAIARAIVEAHGGQVSATSDGVPGHGSIFTVRLPL